MMKIYILLKKNLLKIYIFFDPPVKMALILDEPFLLYPKNRLNFVNYS